MGQLTFFLDYTLTVVAFQWLEISNNDDVYHELTDIEKRQLKRPVVYLAVHQVLNVNIIRKV